MKRRTVIIVGSLVATAGLTGTAFGAWIANSSAGSASAKALSMPIGATPTAPTNSTGSVTLTWNAATLAGSDLASYTVKRYPAAGGAGTTITCAPQTITTHSVSCTYTEATAGSYQYTDTPLKDLWVGTESAKSGTTDVAAALTFTVAPAAGNRTAGSAFNVVLTAKTGGVTDLTYTGNHTINFSGPANSPSGQAPTYPANVTFASGQGTASVTLFKAETNVTLTASETTPSRSGSATVTVVAGAQNQLAFSVTCPSTPGTTMAQSSMWTTAVDILDQWKNPTVHGSTARAIGIASSASNKGTLNGTTSVTVAANADPARSGSFTYTSDANKNQATIITASVTGSPALTAATCSVTT
jgi:hypothetical protein